MRRSLLVWLVAAHGLLISAATQSWSAYAFTSIADSSGAFLDFNTPSVNSSGQVAFRASLDNGGGGVYRGQGGALTTIAETGSTYQGFQYQTPGIDANGNVAFTAVRRPEGGGGEGVFIGNGPSTTIHILTPTTTAPQPGDFAGAAAVVMNDEGTPAFAGAFVGPPLQGIRAGLYVGTALVANDFGAFASFADSLGRGLDVNNHNAVVFKAARDDNSSGIFVVGAGGLATIADTSSGDFASFNFSVPAINDAGDIIFWAEPQPFVDALFTSSAAGGGQPLVFLDGSGPFAHFGKSPAINNLGQIAFDAFLDGTGVGNGIFTGMDPSSDAVVFYGDPLFNSSLATATVSNQSINEAGQIAFHYVLANGLSGIGLATPLPQGDSADFDGDQDVDGADLLIWQRGVAAGTGSAATGDANGDHDVNGQDLAIWKQQFGQANLAAPVPEPAAWWGALSMGLWAAAAARRERCA